MPCAKEDKIRAVEVDSPRDVSQEDKQLPQKTNYWAKEKESTH